MAKMQKQTRKLSSNMEDYLEGIAAIKKEKGVVRIKDIGKFMKVKMPSVTSAVKVLTDMGYINHEKYGYVDITQEGKKKAETIQAKHDVMVKFLTDILNVEEQISIKDACKMEHSISGETFSKLVEFVKSFEQNNNNLSKIR